MKKIDKQKQGKRNIGIGRRFEAKVYKDLEAKGWICARWTKNVEAEFKVKIKGMGKVQYRKRLIPARQGKFRKVSTGFPDFIAFKRDFGLIVEKNGKEIILDISSFKPNIYTIEGIECKSNGYLTKEEKEKCDWLLDNNVFSKILIAKKGKKRGEIEYNEWKLKKK